MTKFLARAKRKGRRKLDREKKVKREEKKMQRILMGIEEERDFFLFL